MAIPLKHLEGKYEILEKLQEGGMGAIYKVRHRLLDELRVVKVLRPQLQDDPSLRVRFLAEARAATQLGHPNIAQVFDCSVDDDGVAFIVMELIPGITLEELLAKAEPPPLPLALEIARQSLRAIGHLHKHDVAHRDVAPDNLMLTRDVDGRPLVKLIDLGIAKDIKGDSKLTGARVFLGKFRYAAPETFEDQGPSDPRRSDLYAFALVLYELLTGRFPIAGENASALIAGHLFRPPLGFSESDPEGRVPEQIRQAILKALAKSPGDRFADAASFKAALDIDLDLDFDRPDIVHVMALTRQEPRQPSQVVRPPGSTQSRLDLQFGVERTPTPAKADARSFEDAPTRILRSTPSSVLEEEETEALRPTPSHSSGAETRRLGLDEVRMMQADELAARAHDRATAEDFAQARDLLRQALALVPDHSRAVALQAGLEAPVAPAPSPTQASEPPPLIVAEPVDGGPATERLDDPGVLRDLRSDAARVREPAANEDSTTVIRVSVTEPDDSAAKASTTLDETLRSIRALSHDGRAGEALERLNRAVREFGSQPTLRTLRDELGEALLERDEEEESASQMFGVAPPPAPPQAQPTTSPAGATPLANAPIRGLSDASIRSFDAPSRQASERPGPPTAPPGRNMLAVGLILAVVFGALVFMLTRQRAGSDRDALEAEDVTAAKLSPGTLALDAVPWAEIVTLDNPAAEDSPALTPSRFTPVILTLPPGEYRITLRYPPTGQVEERIVRVVSDTRVAERVNFESLDAKAYFDRVGW